MAYSYEYPYTDPSRSNSDWILTRIKELGYEFENFVAKNEIKYHDPIQWNITTQYERNTVVKNGNVAYLSKTAVPSGIDINNGYYWLKIADSDETIEYVKKQIAYIDEGTSTTATSNRIIGEYVWLDNLLYKVIANMNAGDLYVVNTNVEKITIESEIDRIIGGLQGVIDSIGDLTTLDTPVKNTIVGAVNSEVASRLVIDHETLKKFKNREFMIVGDSYTADHPIVDYFVQFIGIDPNKVHNVAVSGSGFTGSGDSSFIKQIEDYTGDRNKITDIVVIGGMNDSFSSDISAPRWATLNANMQTFKAYCDSNYPNATVSVGYIGNGIDKIITTNPSDSRVYSAREMCRYYYNAYGTAHGYQMLHNMDIALSVSDLTMESDGIHPNQNGAVEIAKALIQNLYNGTAHIEYVQGLSASLPSTQPAITGSPNLYTVTDDRITTYEFKDFILDVADGTTLANMFQIADTVHSVNKAISKDVIVRLDNFDGKYYQFIQGRVVLLNKVMSLALFSTTDDNQYKFSYVAGAEAKIHIMNTTFDVPTVYLA